MPLFRLSEDIIFPPARFAREDGLLCIGGDLSPGRLIAAYTQGIFPWFSKGDPLLWWSPDPRLLLFPKDIVISKSLKKTIKKNRFTITMDRTFKTVIQNCADLRIHQGEDTWIVDDMIQAYIELHRLGYAHSVEAWQGDTLTGGLYGISLGGAFFGESMFTKVSDGSKTALTALCRHMERFNFDFIDCQVKTDHLISMGAVSLSRERFLKLLKLSLKKKDHLGPWTFNGFES